MTWGWRSSWGWCPPFCRAPSRGGWSSWGISIHGVLSHVEGLGDKLRVAMDSWAKRIMIPTVNRKDFATLPDEVVDKMQIEFYSDPAQAAFKALAEG